MMDHASLLHQLSALVQVLLIDLMLAGDNAVVVGLAVAGLPPEKRRIAIILGIGAATVIRIIFAAITVQLLAIVGLLLAGGLLLLWVAWKMFRELRDAARHPTEAPASKTMRQAMTQIMLADLSMSLDNVLAVAGASGGHMWVLVVGLAVSVVLMGVAANLIAKLLVANRWIAWAGLSIVLFVALKLVWDGGHEILARLG